VPDQAVSLEMEFFPLILSVKGRRKEMSDGLVNLLLDLLVGIIDAVDRVSEKTESGRRLTTSVLFVVIGLIVILGLIVVWWWIREEG
jgi:hypothetical protein